MKKIKIFKCISISSYLLIILMGEMIGLPFFFWLAFTLFEFGNVDQLFAFLAVVGLTINFINRNKKKSLNIILLDIVCFLLLASPIISRMTSVPVKMFNYIAFIIPVTVFALFYLVSLVYSVKQYLQDKSSTNA